MEASQPGAPGVGGTAFVHRLQTIGDARSFLRLHSVEADKSLADAQSARILRLSEREFRGLPAGDRSSCRGESGMRRSLSVRNLLGEFKRTAIFYFFGRKRLKSPDSAK